MLCKFLEYILLSPGKDEIIFLTKEDYKEPSEVELNYDKEDEQQMGLIRPDGEINWNCPCLQGMADGPCGDEFKKSFSCFHYSEADPKGSDCIPQFRDMQECFMKHPEVYGPENDTVNTETQENLEEKEESSANNVVTSDGNSMEEVGESIDNSEQKDFEKTES